VVRRHHIPPIGDIIRSSAAFFLCIGEHRREGFAGRRGHLQGVEAGVIIATIASNFAGTVAGIHNCMDDPIIAVRICPRIMVARIVPEYKALCRRLCAAGPLVPPNRPGAGRSSRGRQNSGDAQTRRRGEGAEAQAKGQIRRAMTVTA
jgi:hypothetical protein